MRYLLDIARGVPGEKPFRQTFAYESDDASDTVATALTAINLRESLTDVEGASAAPVRWECSCLQRRCGACAMLIDGRPGLACDVKLAECASTTIRLDPLAKFPLIADLMVDRTSIFEGLERTGAWLEHETGLAVKRSSEAMEASKCLQCGCCLEVCPNFALEGGFRGASSMMAVARLLAVADPSERKRLAKSYREAYYGGCGKSLSCQDICPAGLSVERLASRSNAAAVWGRY